MAKFNHYYTLGSSVSRNFEADQLVLDSEGVVALIQGDDVVGIICLSPGESIVKKVSSEQSTRENL